MSFSVEQYACRDPERFGEFLDDGDGGVPRTALDVRDIGAMDPSTVGIILLAPALLVAEAAQIGGEALADVHAA